MDDEDLPLPLGNIKVAIAGFLDVGNHHKIVEI